jgi:predicted nuclease with RNAse H fold/dephospho-CoA kinase
MAALQRAAILVTFNGSGFDLPFLRYARPDVPMPKIHVDLRYLARRVGLTGPQKVIEPRIGVRRAHDLRDIAGRDAPVLWHRYCYGDRHALRQLIRYNRADLEGMRALILHVSARLLRRCRYPLSSAEHAVLKRATKRIIVSAPSWVPVFRGRIGPVVTYQELASANDMDGLRVVGIDLTGSEKRPSGWALLDGPRASAKLIASDAELFEETVRARPDLVSIDSPLSLPAGTRFNEESEELAAPSIMRKCERILRQRGVSVYPCLIPSMRALTLRGIKLATALRRHGIPVIESYPGAAQDILGIPRKRASLDLLRLGLNRFGLTGDALVVSRSHDELDAITSALVGIFYWSGRFEALGDEAEGYLIVPEVLGDSVVWRPRVVIGLSGPIGAGKTTVGTALQEHGFFYARFSALLADLLRERGVEPTRESLQEFGRQIYEGGRQRWLCEQLIARVPKDADVVIDGLRHPEDHSCLAEAFGPRFVHIHIEADRSIRATRYAAPDFDEVTAHPSESDVGRLAELAHVRVENNGALAQLIEVVMNLVNDVKHRRKRTCQ